MNNFNLGGFEKIIKTLKQAGYKFLKFSELNPSEFEESEPFVLMRHDIDFSILNAIKIANIEFNEGVRSTFFLKLRSPLYNLLGQLESQTIERIFGYGHEIALHFDLNGINENLISRVEKDVNIFSNLFPFVNRNLVSFHLPAKHIDLLQELNLPGSMRHTYEKDFFSKIAYFSDSKCEWRFGHPLNSDEFHRRLPLHILIHPLWWTEDGKDKVNKIKNFLKGHMAKNLDYIEKTVVTFSLKSIQND